MILTCEDADSVHGCKVDIDVDVELIIAIDVNAKVDMEFITNGTNGS